MRGEKRAVASTRGHCRWPAIHQVGWPITELKYPIPANHQLGRASLLESVLRRRFWCVAFYGPAPATPLLGFGEFEHQTYYNTSVGHRLANPLWWVLFGTSRRLPMPFTPCASCHRQPLSGTWTLAPTVIWHLTPITCHPPNPLLISHLLL
jgi:hypothetical protein